MYLDEVEIYFAKHSLTGHVWLVWWFFFFFVISLKTGMEHWQLWRDPRDQVLLFLSAVEQMKTSETQSLEKKRNVILTMHIWAMFLDVLCNITKAVLFVLFF